MLSQHRGLGFGVWGLGFRDSKDVLGYMGRGLLFINSYLGRQIEQQCRALGKDPVGVLVQVEGLRGEFRALG